MSEKIRFIIALWMGIMGGSLFAELESGPLNSIERLDNGWMRIVGGDPYLTFNGDNTPLNEIKAVRITIAGKNVKNRHSYTEFFWATDAHGYTEEYKGFFIAPYTVESGGHKTVLLNFEEFLQAIGEPGTRLHALRVDFDKSIAVPQFQFQCTIELLSEIPASTEGEVSIALHAPYLSRYLLKADLFKYTMRHLVADFFTRVFRDWVFVILYLFAVGVTIAGIVIFRGKRE